MKKQKISPFFTSSTNLLLVFLKKVRFFWIFLLMSTHIYSQNESYNYFVYGVKLKDSSIAVQSELADIFGFGQPEEVYYTVLYKGDISYKFFNYKIAKGDSVFSVDDIFDDYSMTDLKSGIVLRNLKLGKRIYRSGLSQTQILHTTEKRKIKEHLTDKYYSVNRFGDTTFFFVVDDIPKNSGILLLRDLKGAILAMESKKYSTYPLYSGKLSISQRELDAKFKFEIINANSLEKNWIESANEKIEVGHKFPAFTGTTILGKGIDNSLFAKRKKTVLLLLDHISFTEKQTVFFQKMGDKMQAQTEKILNAIIELSKANSDVQYVIISDDVMEEIDANRYKGIEVIGNALAWKEQIGLFQSPYFLLVSKEGIVKKFNSIMDIEIMDGFRIGLQSFSED
ncbi:MAG TPA: hypothetical protein PKA77_00875 [Chitinophagaceae bacterium]|jgi:hypothetical protein|nr:hypothetical protein [Chitinophagaceae bacterium]HMU56963.1 hypothetical protein [Chitinophagaceae bacterium]